MEKPEITVLKIAPGDIVLLTLPLRFDEETRRAAMVEMRSALDQAGHRETVIVAVDHKVTAMSLSEEDVIEHLLKRAAAK